jgi:isopenicillin-N N-acyltransferase-like protein
VNIEHVEVAGTDFELGLQQGHRLAHLISLSAGRANQWADRTRESVLDASRRIEATLLTRFPHLVREMQGIADGAGLPYEEILLLNVGYDTRSDRPEAARHCTAIGLPDTAEGPLVAKTDDVAIDERQFEVFFRVRPHHGHAFIHYAFAGTVWDQGGINEAGLALAMTGLGPAGPRNHRGLPSLLFLREVLLRCSDVAEALTFAEEHPLRGHGCSMTMADPGSDAITVVENYPSLRAIHRSHEEATVRTNHPHCEPSQALPPDETWAQRMGHPLLGPNSKARWQNASRLTRDIPWSIEGLEQLLGDHAEPGAVCQHGQAGLHTSFAVIMVPRQRALVAAEGYGCEAYVRHEF